MLEADLDLEPEAVADHVNDARAEFEGEPVVVGEPVLERLLVGVPDPVDETVPDLLIVADEDTVGLLVAAERVAVTVFVPETEGDPETVVELVTLTDPEGLPELEGLPETLGELVPDILCVGEPEGVCVDVPVRETVADALGVGVAGKHTEGRALSIGPVKE